MPGAYLDYAGIGLVRSATRAAMHSAVEDTLARGGENFRSFFAVREQARASAARLLDCGADELAHVLNTSTALHLVADGLSWHRGDEVVVFERDFPANVQPWRRLEAGGVRLRWVPMRDGGYDLGDLAAELSPRTRLITVSHVNFLTGFRIDPDAVCELASDVEALVCVDAAQSLGVLPRFPRRCLSWLPGPRTG